MSLDAELNVITEDYVEKRPVDVYFQDNILLYTLLGNGGLKTSMVGPGDTVDGGKKIKVILEYAMSHAGGYGNTTMIPQSKKDILNAALFRWAGYYASNTIDLDDQVQNNGDAALVNLAWAKLRNIEKSIRDQMGTDIYSAAADGVLFNGLGDLFNTTSSAAYGNIKEDDMAEWKANLDDTSEAISFKVMQGIKRTAKVGQNKQDKPNLYITTDLLKDGYERTLQSQQRFYDESLVKAGFDNIMFSQAPVVADDKQGSGVCDGLNTNYLSIKTHTKYGFTTPKWEYSKDQPDTLTANTRYIGNLVCKNRKAHCRHTNLTEPS